MVMSFGLGTIVADDRCGVIMNEAIRNWNEQKNFRFPPTGVKVEFAYSDPSIGQPTSRESILVSNGNHGLAVTSTSYAERQAGSLYIQMTNEKYFAMIDHLPDPNQAKFIRLDQLKTGFRISGFSGLNGDEVWIDRAIRADISGGFLVSSIFDFPTYVKAWKSGNATAECTISETADQPHQIQFQNLSGTEFSQVDHCIFGIDTISLLITKVEFYGKEFNSKFIVDSFFEIGEVRFPEKVLLSHPGSDSRDGEMVIRSMVLSPESLGFDNQQLYLSWYGLAEPNAAVVATRSRSNGYYYIAFGLLLAIGTAILYWRKNR